MRQKIRIKEKEEIVQNHWYRDPAAVLVVLYCIFILLFFLLGKVAVTRAGTLGESDDSSSYGLLLKSENGECIRAPLLSTEVDIRISGMLARTTVTQYFVNNSDQWLEGVYVFPLPDESAVDQLRMEVNERVIEGEIRKRDKAREIYNTAKELGKKTTLVEQERPNIFTTSVANIGPGEKVSVEIGYQETVSYNNRTFSLRFPMVVGVRYIPGLPASSNQYESLTFTGRGWAQNTDKVPDANRITPPVQTPDKKPANPISLTVDLNSGLSLKRISSPYHAVMKKKLGKGHYSIQLENRVWTDRDFVLEWQPEIGSEPSAALFAETRGEEKYLLLMIMPPDRQKLPALKPREIIFVLDISGSMAGPSIMQARESVSLAVSRLGPTDLFNVIVFNNTARSIFTGSRRADKNNVSQALRFIENLNAQGGTNIASALEMALDGYSEHQFPRQIVFLTDGCAGNEKELFQIISSRLGDSRLFTVGIGSAPNSFFMTRAAEFGRGTFTYIGDLSEVGDKMMFLFEKLESQTMSDIKLKAEKSSLLLYPEKIPDIYSTEPLLVSAKMHKSEKKLYVSGKVAGNPWRMEVDLTGGGEFIGIAKLWARKKIRHLMNQMTLTNEQDLIRNEVTDTALKYQLVSKYTSLVAVEKTVSRPEKSDLQSAMVEVNLPSGWQYDKIFGGRARTGTSSLFFLLLGSLLLLLFFYMSRSAIKR